MDYNFKYVLSNLAKQDLKSILEFLNNVNPKILDSFERKFKIACKTPYIYQLDTSSKLSKKFIRRIPCNGYIIYYQINEKEKRIDIGRIRHEKQNNKNLQF